MVFYLDIYTYAVSCNCVVALFTNSLLIFLIVKHTKVEMGKYKYLLIFFAGFNIVYALVFFFGIPVNFVSDRTWIVFSHGLLSKTPFAFWGASLYCTFYELWILLVDIHFVYRYVIVCRRDWTIQIQQTKRAKFIVILALIGCATFAIMCGNYVCSREVMSKSMAEKITTVFQLENAEKLGYVQFRTQTLEGDISIFGITAIVDHYLLAYVSFMLIIFCGWKTWKAINEWQNIAGTIRAVRLQRQLLFALLFQTAIPFFLCHLPTMIYLCVPTLGFNLTFGSFSVIFAVLTSLIKVIDPIIVILCLGDYRRALSNILKGKGHEVSSTTHGVDLRDVFSVEVTAFSRGAPSEIERSAQFYNAC